MPKCGVYAPVMPAGRVFGCAMLPALIRERNRRA